MVQWLIHYVPIGYHIVNKEHEENWIRREEMAEIELHVILINLSKGITRTLIWIISNLE